MTDERDDMSRPDPSAHLTAAQIGRFRRRELPAGELLAFSDHLEVCADCRARVAAPDALVEAGRQLDAALDVAGSHVPEEDVHRYVDGTLDAVRRSAVAEHLEHCLSCGAEIRDLQQFARRDAGVRVSRAAWWYVGLAAAAALLLGVFVLGRMRPAAPMLVALNDGGTRIGVDALGHVDGVSGLAPADLSLIRQAIVAGQLRVPDPASARAVPGGSLRGPGDPPAFSVIAPAGTAVLSDRPSLTWTPLTADATYVVRLRDEVTGATVVSPPLRATEWTPPAPLARGETYVWQVEASAGGRDVTAPVPPAPAARFWIVDAAEAARLAQAPASHLVRGVLYASAGLLDEAERELTALQAQNPESEMIRRFVDQLALARRR
jgi:anti-sigma factor RsiW